MFRIFLTLVLLLFSVSSKADFWTLVKDRADEGIGSWQEMPFGQMRILSCSTGVKDLAMVVGGLQVQLNPGWSMKKPVLRPLSSQFPSWMEAPVVLGDGRFPVYQGDILFPLVLMRDPRDKKPFHLGVEGDFPLCYQEKCLTFPIKIVLPLLAETAEYTPFCAYLINQQRQVPLPGKVLGITGTAWQEGGRLHFAFQGIKGAQIAFLQTLQSEPFEVEETQLEDQGILMRVRSTPWAVGTDQEWVLLSDQGIFKVPVKMKTGPVSLPANQTSWKIWLLGWELFFLTPLFIWWGLGVGKTTKIWRKSLIQGALFLPLVLGLKGLLNENIPLEAPLYSALILGGVSLFPPQKNWGALLLFLLWPYFPKIPSLPPLSFVLWIAVMWGEVMLPFAFSYLLAEEIGKFLRALKKNRFFLYNLIFLLPTLILLGQVIWTSCQDSPAYGTALNPDGFSIVCSKKECLKWQKTKDVYFISPQTVLGKTLQKMYQRSTVVLWQNQGERFILSPGISAKKAQEFTFSWQSYHALDTP